MPRCAEQDFCGRPLRASLNSRSLLNEYGVLTVPGLDARDVVESAGEDSDNGVEQSGLSQKVHICAGCIAEEEAQKA
jgi:hypothetical protein